MKKVMFYSFLATAILFSGCGKNKDVQLNEEVVVEEVVDNGNSEGILNQMPDTDIEEVSSNGTFELSDSTENGVYYFINGKKVFIDNIYFAFDKYSLNSKNKEKAEANASKLSALNSDTTVKVLGNTDEWGTDEYNYALGLKRAKAVKDVLVMDGVPSSAISVVSFGESNPVCTEQNATCWQKNRRTEHKLVK